MADAFWLFVIVMTFVVSYIWYETKDDEKEVDEMVDSLGIDASLKRQDKRN